MIKAASRTAYTGDIKEIIMRKADREIGSRSDLIDTIRRCAVCRIGFQTGGAPYLVPMSFGFSDNDDGSLRLYFHCATEGRKLDLLRVNPHVGFEMDSAHELITADRPCGYSQNYESVTGEGVMRVLEGDEARITALSKLMEHYDATGYDHSDDYNPEILAQTCVLELEVTALSGKRLAKRQ
jgi:nitroimidazol reductase NimA-like FMN-containing flavoprotein (pyridoxamine 5'-phosphate oxidase superfamily)